MEEIVAAANHVIELQEDGKWRLVVTDELSRRTLLEAQSDGAIIFYQHDFGRMRGLPERNWVTRDQIRQILVGWAPQERCWILGLQLNSNGAGAPKWCELVRFPVSPSGAFSSQAQRAARALASVVGSPLRIIPDDSTPPVPAAPVRHAAPMKPKVSYRLPMELSERELNQMPAGLRLSNTGRWMFGQVMQVFGYLALSAIFAFVSEHSLNTPYAPVHDSWLPLVGIVLTVVLGAVSVWQAVRVFRAWDIVFDRERGALYYLASLGRWFPAFRRQMRAPMPLRAIKAVVARNVNPRSKNPEWILFLQTAENALVLSHLVEENSRQSPRAVQAAAAIADVLGIPLRIILRGVGDDASHTFKCDMCGATLAPDQLHWGDDGEMHCTFCGAPVDTGR
ncbi:MAG: hypothetical protein JXB47_18665 [Anaerolineae bacterium]|nr:hypothetical protein [Anaerolineae bacterium]